LGSAGPVLLGSNEIGGGGKQGKLYLVQRSSLGHQQQHRWLHDQTNPPIQFFWAARPLVAIVPLRPVPNVSARVEELKTSIAEGVVEVDIRKRSARIQVLENNLNCMLDQTKPKKPHRSKPESPMSETEDHRERAGLATLRNC
jgi:hypothetical protein